MKRILLLLTLLISFTFVHAQNVAGDDLRIYKNAQIGEDGNATINMHSNRVQGVADPISLLDAVNLQYFTNNMSLTQPIDSLSLTPLTDSDISTDYTMYADSLSYGGAFRTGLGGYVYKLGQATVLLYYNDNAYAIEAFDVLHLKGGALVNGQLYPTPELADASEWEKTQGTLSVAAHAIAPNSFGFTVLYGILKGGSTLGLTAGGQLWLSDDGTGDLTSTRPEFQSYSISMGGAFNTVAAPDGQVFINVTRDITNTFDDAWDGAARETFDFRVTSDGVTITGSLENVINTNDLTLIFSDGFYTFDVTPAATLTLVAGTTTVPQLNYVFIDDATKTLQVSTGGFPILEHSKIATVAVLDAVATQSDGALRNQNHNDHIKKEDDNGHILHIATRLRKLNAEWDSGAETVLSGTPTNVYFSNPSGNVYQLHLQPYEAQDMSIGDDIHVVNDPVTAYRTTTNLNDITVFSDGSAWNNEWSNLVVWGVANKSGEISHLMVNLPSDGYNAEADAFDDQNNFTDYNIPKDFKGVGFLLGRFTIRRSGVNFTYNLSAGYLDLRGFVPNNTAGSGGGGPSGITSYLNLDDTSNSYIGFSGQAATVTALEDGLEFTPVVTTINGGSPTLGDYIITSTANKVGEDVTIGTSGTGVDAVFSVADNDNVIGNEFQNLTNSKLNNDITIEISDGANTTVTNLVRNDFANVLTELNLFSGGLSGDKFASGSEYFGLNAGDSETTGGVNVGIGRGALRFNQTGSRNTSAGISSSINVVGGDDGVSIGASAVGTQTSSTGEYVAVGSSASNAGTIIGGGYVSVGHGAANSSVTLTPNYSNSVYVGKDTRTLGGVVTNENVFGYAADGKGLNTVVIGNSLITDNYFNGIIHATKTIRSTGLNTSGMTGEGVELSYFNNEGDLAAYDRTGFTYMPLNLRGTSVKLYNGVGAAATLRLSTNTSGVDVNGNVDADSYSIGATEVIDASRNIDAVSGAFSGSVNISSNVQLQWGTPDRAKIFGTGGENLVFWSQGTERMRTSLTGVDVTGDVTATVDVNCVDLNYSGALNDVSDQRVKDSIRDFAFNREAFKRLSVKRYNYKSDSTDVNYINPMAQALEVEFPWLVNHSKSKIVRNDSIISISTLSDIEKSNIKDEDRLHTIKSMQLSVMAVEGLRLEMIKNDSLQLIVDENKFQVEVLKSLIKNLDDRLKALEN